MNFGTKLKMLRTYYNLDQEQISRRLSVSQPVYCRYENNKKIVFLQNDFVQRVSMEFGVDPGWLIGEDETVDFQRCIPEAAKKEGFYNIPKELFEAFLKQQSLIQLILKKIT